MYFFLFYRRIHAHAALYLSGPCSSQEQTPLGGLKMSLCNRICTSRWVGEEKRGIERESLVFEGFTNYAGGSLLSNVFSCAPNGRDNETKWFQERSMNGTRKQTQSLRIARSSRQGDICFFFQSIMFMNGLHIVMRKLN
jgi:hypothetical protein